MKQIIYILSALSLLLLLSCEEVEDGDYNTKKTLQGKLAFNQVQTYTNDVVYLTEMVSRASLYMQSPKEEKQTIAEFYFPQYTVIENVEDKTIIINNQTSKWTFTHIGKSVNETGAIWWMEVSNTTEKGFMTLIEPQAYKLESRGNKEWTITVSNIIPNMQNILQANSQLMTYLWNTGKEQQYSMTIEVSAKQAVSQAPNLYNYTITSGQGYNKGNGDFLNFQCKAPIVYTSDIYNPLKMTEAAVDIQITISTGIKDLIHATLKDNETEITMGGITELYDNYW